MSEMNSKTDNKSDIDNSKVGIISKETAEYEIKKLMEFYDVDESDYVDPNNKGNPGELLHNRTLRRLIRAMTERKLEIKWEESVPVIYQKVNHHPNIKTLRWKPLDAAARTACKSDNENVRLQELAGALTGEDQVQIRKLMGGDCTLMEYLASFFISM